MTNDSRFFYHISAKNYCYEYTNDGKIYEHYNKERKEITFPSWSCWFSLDSILETKNRLKGLIIERFGSDLEDRLLLTVDDFYL